jgi:hypothetical protein
VSTFIRVAVNDWLDRRASERVLGSQPVHGVQEQPPKAVGFVSEESVRAARPDVSGAPYIEQLDTPPPQARETVKMKKTDKRQR